MKSIALANFKTNLKRDEQIIARRGQPANIRSDNGPEFISEVMARWCEDKQISWHFIQPGRPMQNAYIERKNGSMRRELLNAYAFDSLKEAREQCAVYRQDYNEERPHKSLGDLTRPCMQQNTGRAARLK